MDRKFTFTFQHILLTVTSVCQILIAVLLYRQPVNSTVRNIGWVIMWISGIFGWMPMYTFKKYGEVDEGISYIHTRKVVNKGIYGIVRHPQYLSGILLSAGLFLIAPHWVSLCLGVLNAAQYYQSAFQEEHDSIEKFGDAYEEYKKRVPRFNFILGIINKIKRAPGIDS